jgi:hypothetical protein
MTDIKLPMFDKDIKEKDVEAALVKEVKKLGGEAEKFTSPGRRSVPDRICSFEPCYIGFVECKAPGKKPTEKQAKDHERRRAMGFRVLVVDSIEAARLAALTLYKAAKEWE